MPNNAIEVIGVSKNFGSYQALKGISFVIRRNEFFTMLGPSGCGKTTLLRMIAGFESPDEGTILLNGTEVIGIPPHKRRVNTVFQSYALFPHMTVEQNVAFGIENLGWDKARIRARAGEMLERVHMSQFAARKPTQLSGGQRQRIALARALAPEPEVLLLDEPLSALDLKLRQAMRDELRSLQRDTGITFVFVTHDQEEALDMSDRIAVLGSGEVQQLGTPTQIYEEPVSRFVADFVGETNFLPVEVLETSSRQATIRTPFDRIMRVSAPEGLATGPATLSVRPEKINLGDQVVSGGFAARVVNKNYMGGYTHYQLLAHDMPLRASRRNASRAGDRIEVGAMIEVGFSEAAARVLPA
ncbi:spermidine/putrescine ABC transporter ATP-binding protein [Haematobacter massiliensis]|uniref:Spermidine/putrescine import ATP-binding protein PotA n=1 Tax=Haematobacter massiliensis TaxID=195105 RepID=A0A086Y2B1_9RHOB|nr:ABC transporter ATP-binding protein [Haematobacter massiliensis]KFI28411.1 spermidine/putrescine ABC transporter ATP-binding protein [Haematobacter massiliensis]OWJ84647.1 polyamine ABC transporter ATP-binding protein [Haematobacter massiliensis]QBJ26390.1 ABC transporter ATP-binding protein [Haematobacter massiliensis]